MYSRVHFGVCTLPRILSIAITCDTTYIPHRSMKPLSYLIGVTLILSSLYISQSPSVHIPFIPEAKTTRADSVELMGYAWSENIGWISVNCANTGTCATSNYKVTLDTATNNLTGYGWSEHIGWIQFGGLTGCPAGDCDARMEGGELMGWIRAVAGDGIATYTAPATQTFATAGIGQSFVVPAGVTSVTVKAWGAGGGAASGGTGGGGGFAQSTVTVTPNEPLLIDVGAGGAATGANGGDSTFRRASTHLVRGGGGGGGNGSAGSGGVGYVSTTGATSSGSGATPGNTSDSAYVASAGVGAASGPETLGTFTNVGTLPGNMASSQFQIVGNSMILFSGIGGGGSGATAAVYAASTSNPLAWVNTGASSGDRFSAMSTVAGGYVYLLGGSGDTGNPSSATYRAPVSNPTSWAGASGLPSGLGASQAVVIGNNVFLFGGTSGGSGTRNIYAASTTAPTLTWVNTGRLIPEQLFHSQAAVIGDYVYLFGGVSSGIGYRNVIFRAPLADPTNWVNTGATLPAGLAYSKIFMTGSNIYLIGGAPGGVFAALGPIYRASISDPLTWVNTGATLPTSLYYHSGTILNNTLYLFGGISAGAMTNRIYSAPITGGSAAGNAGRVVVTYDAPIAGPTNGWDGWISLNCSNTGSCGTSNYKTNVGTSELTGYAWGSDVVGWISMNCSDAGTCAASNYRVYFTGPCDPPTYQCINGNTESQYTDPWCTVTTTTCNSGEMCRADMGSICGPGNPTGQLVFSSQRVRKGNTTNISWPTLAAYDMCRVNGTPTGGATDSWTWSSTTPLANVTTSAIQNEVTYTLECTRIGDVSATYQLLDTERVTILPSIKEF